MPAYWEVTNVVVTAAAAAVEVWVFGPLERRMTPLVAFQMPVDLEQGGMHQVIPPGSSSVVPASSPTHDEPYSE